MEEEKEREGAMEKEGEGKAMGKRGCIRSTQEPWKVRRERRDGVVTYSLRYPTHQEREKNRKRERLRRKVAGRIYAGLRAHGGYCLPKHADQNDILKALCEEAGYRVDDDGNVVRESKGKNAVQGNVTVICSAAKQTNCPALLNFFEGPSNCNHLPQLTSYTGARETTVHEELSLDLTLSFKYM